MKYIDEWLDSVGAERDALKFKNGCYIVSGRGNGKSLSALEQMKRYLEDHPDAKIVMPYHHGYSYYKELINSAYGRKKSQHDDMPAAIASAINEFDIIKEKEINKMANVDTIYTFTTKDFKGCRYEITIEKSFTNNVYPYHVRLYSLDNVDGARSFIRTFGYSFWEQLETQLMYDLAGNDGIVVCKDCRDEVTCELERARHKFGGSSYVSFDSPYQGGYTTGYKITSDRSKVKPFELMPKIEKVIFNPPATIVKWKDGTKTVVKCQDDDEFDWEKGLAMAYVKRAFNNERTYYGLFKKNEPENYTQETLMDRVNKLTKVIKDFGANTSIDQSTIKEVKRYSDVPDTSSIDAEGPLMPL